MSDHDETGEPGGPNDSHGDSPPMDSFSDLLPKSSQPPPLPRRPSTRPSFFPDETPEQSRAYADDLKASLRPGAPSANSGLYDTGGLRTLADHEQDGDISTVVLVHTSDEPAADGGKRRSLVPKPGLMSALLGQERALADEGAIAAWRTVPLRRRRDTQLPLLGTGPQVERARARLCLHLAENATGAVRAQLLLAAAERSARVGEHDATLAAHDAAYKAAPEEPLALERQLTSRLRAGDTEGAAPLMEARTWLPVSAPERALAACTLAEAQLAGGAIAEANATLHAARATDGGSLLVELLQAELTWKAHRVQEAAQALRRASELAGDDTLRSALALAAARSFEQLGDAGEALSLYARASAADPSSLAAALGAYRSCRALGQLDGAQRALGTLAELCDGEQANTDQNAAAPERSPLAAEITRQRARLLHEMLGRSDDALHLLASARSVVGVRAKARVAEALGAEVMRVHALQSWVDAASGSERALALLELATFYADRNQRDAAEQTLNDAALAGAPRPLLGLLRESLARSHADAAGLSLAALDEDSAGNLRAAAKLAHAPAEVARELELLARAAAAGDPCAEILSIDAAAELASLEYLQGALARSAARMSAEDRLGPQLALLDLLGDSESEASRAVQAELHESTPSSTLALRTLAARAPDSQAAARLWLAEAAACDGERAAFAATVAGRYLEDAGVDPTEAYAEALDAVRGFAPACYALEGAMRAHGDVLALERVQRELATTTEAASERAERRVRLSLLAAEGDPQAALQWLDLAAEERPHDLLLAELALRAVEDAPAEVRAERWRRAATLETTPRFARAMQLRAAAMSEDAGQWDAAVEQYEALRAGVDERSDAFAELGLAHALRQAQRYDGLIARSERSVLQAQSEVARRAALTRLADLELERGEPGRACVVLETLLETDERLVPALRTLERLALDDGDDTRTLLFASRLAQHASDELDRAAELRLAVRLDAKLGLGNGDSLLLDSEGRITHDLWFALSLEAFALRSGDRVRFYDAARAIADNLEDRVQRATYAVRAAEAFEAAAPSRAAADLEKLLSEAPEHPLAIEELARLYKAAGDPRRAAETFRRAADSAPNERRSTQLLHAAGVIFHDELSDRDAALDVLLRATSLDVLYADAFERARVLLEARGDERGMLALLERRLAAKAEPALLAQWQKQRAQLYLKLGDRTRAKQALRDALTADPTLVDALRLLAQWHSEDGEYREASDALVQLARVASDPEVLAQAFHALGELYDGPLPDERRAEIAFTRVVALAPADHRPIERLIAIWIRRNDHERAARALAHLCDHTTGDENAARRQGYLVQLATEQTALGDERLAERTLEDGRRAAPGSLPILRALRELYERQQDPSALAIHLVRSCHALRAAIEADPGDVSLWHGLIEFLNARGRGDGALLVTEVARCIGHSLGELQPIRGLGHDALGDDVLRRITPRGALEAARALLSSLPPALAAFLPATSSDDDAPLQTGSSRVPAAVVELFGLSAIEPIGSDANVCVPLDDAALRIRVGRELFAAASEAQRFFLFTRAAAVARHGVSALVRCDPEQLLLFAHALLKLEDPRHEVAALDLDALAALSDQLGAALSAEERARVLAKLGELQSEGDWNPRRTAAQAWDYGSRVALCASGDCVAAFDALLRLRGHDPITARPEDRASLARSDGPLRALLSFALSEAYLDLRRDRTSR
jgi:tetratricopeptide (TPR) repeat protein